MTQEAKASHSMSFAMVPLSEEPTNMFKTPLSLPLKFPALARYAYERGIYRSEVVEKDDGIVFLKALGIHRNPFLIFSHLKDVQIAKKQRKRRTSGWQIFLSKRSKRSASNLPSCLGAKAKLAAEAWEEMTVEEKEPFKLEADEQNDVNMLSRKSDER